MDCLSEMQQALDIIISKIEAADSELKAADYSLFDAVCRVDGIFDQLLHTESILGEAIREIRKRKHRFVKRIAWLRLFDPRRICNDLEKKNECIRQAIEAARTLMLPDLEMSVSKIV
ncbi:hypothetical protein FOL46_007770 [Perkinsus olseni]|uniref:Uncharacterized protein n=1 Tax=Perkinsus olseni TaxID=32597 RepID=A0A7J6LC55_PEROL|nr:hypothetical protein FOL46_007770 [Perkinsus olseni]